MNQKRKKQKRNLQVPIVLLLIVLLGGVSYTVAWSWQSAQEAGGVRVPEERDAVQEEAEDPAELQTATPPDPVVAQQPAAEEEGLEGSGQAAEEPVEAEEPAPEEPEEEDAGEEPQGPSLPADRPDFTGAVAPSAKVTNEYFDDAIFLGDSISVGIPLYSVLPGAKVVAAPGIDTVNALKKTPFEAEGGDQTLLEAAAACGDKGKVYIMLGGNGMGYEKDVFISGYREFLKAAKEQYPGAVIYVQSIPPVTESGIMKERYPTMSNELIEEYNLAILALTRELGGLHYLDVASVLMDETGRLPEEASPLDGVHFTAEYYYKWFEYLKTHTVGERA